MPEAVRSARGRPSSSSATANTVIVEQNPDRCERIADRFRGVVIRGDATQPDILGQADLDKADVFPALTGDDRRNARLCARARRLADGFRTVARTGEPTARVDAADTMVTPVIASAKATAETVLGWGLQLCDRPIEGVDLATIPVDPRAPAAGHPLRAVRFPTGSQVIADVEQRSVVGRDTKLRPGREYLVAVEPRVAADVRNLLRG